jgi:tRNA (mo5U34)-methyltransferase
MQAGGTGAGVSVSVGGRLLQRLHKHVADRQRAQRDLRLRVIPAPPVSAESPQAATIRHRIDGVGWYHTIDLGCGVLTAGEFNHIPYLDHYKLPASLHGKRVLDIGAFDGFWAFEFERRGAREVVALDVERIADLDLPPTVRASMAAETLQMPLGRGFNLARDILGSGVERRIGSAYTLSPDAWGMFDVTHIGNVLVHLRDPTLALQKMAWVTGELAIISETVDGDLEGDPRGALLRYMGGHANCNWWRFSESALVNLVRDAGFSSVEVVSRFAIPHRGSARDMRQIVIEARRK